MKLCDQCEDRPAMSRYRDAHNGAEHEWCTECAARIVKTDCRTFELMGPADNLEARTEWARGLIHMALNDLLNTHTLPEVVDRLAPVLVLPDFVWEAAMEYVDTRHELAKAG